MITSSMAQQVPAEPPSLVFGRWRRRGQSNQIRDITSLGCQAAGVFDLASVTKVLATTTALMRLASMGRLDVDAPVATWIPGLALHEGTTVADLLEHQAGLVQWQPFYLAPEVRQLPAGQRRDMTLRLVGAMPPQWGLRQGRHYSDLGFILLGHLIEVITGMRLDQAIAMLVTEPMRWRLGYGPVRSGAVTSQTGDAAEKRMVTTGEPYPVQWSDEGFAWREDMITGQVNDGNAFHAMDGVSGHAGLFGTLDQMMEAGMALAMAEQDRQFFDPGVVRRFMTPGVDPGQALGWRCDTLQVDGESMPMRYHLGFTGMGLGFVPGGGRVIALASNRLMADPAPRTDQLWHRACAWATRPEDE